MAESSALYPLAMGLSESELDRLTNETVELLQGLIRNECVNDGTKESGFEDRSARVLEGELEGLGLDIERYETAPGRSSIVTRYEGTDPDAPALCLMGHTDVVPVTADGWSRDPFGGELITNNDGIQEVWGRGAVDMLNLTSSMAVAFRHMVKSGKRYAGDIVYFAVADEEAGATYGAQALLDQQWDHLKADYVLTEFGGIPLNDTLLLTTAEKGAYWWKLHVKGTPGHGSMPYGADNALVKAGEVIRRIAAYNPGAQMDRMWEARVKAMDLGPEISDMLLDPDRIYDGLALLPDSIAKNAHSCSHTTFSPNMIHGGVKTNVIPDRVTIDIDIRTLPGEETEDVFTHLRVALGDLYDDVQIESGDDWPASASPVDGKLWGALEKSMGRHYPDKALVPSMVTGGTDARFYRDKGAIAYGAGLLSPSLNAVDFLQRFHGHDERIDVESLRMTTQLWLDIADVLWD